jgi:predicted O-methyltransferase YrrM
VVGIQQFNQFMSEHPQIDAAIVPIGDGMCIGVVTGDEKQTTE